MFRYPTKPYTLNPEEPNLSVGLVYGCCVLVKVCAVVGIYIYTSMQDDCINSVKFSVLAKLELVGRRKHGLRASRNLDAKPKNLY